MSDEDTLPVRVSECGKCKGPRNCDIIGKYDERGGDHHFDWRKVWYLLKCRGCNHVFCQTVETDSESFDWYWDDEIQKDVREHIETNQYWPAITERPKPIWFENLDLHDLEGGTKLSRALEEVYIALEADLRTLSGMGIRTVFDILSEMAKVEEHKSFEDKLKDLLDRGLVDEDEKNSLAVLIQAGNAAAHRGWRPKKDELSSLMDVLEGFIADAFIYPKQAERRRAAVAAMKVPAKKPKPKKGDLSANQKADET